MAEPVVEHLDVIIVGAGLSGVGAACHLQTECPGKTYAILEARAESGGTWDLFRYPGVRSDSDMFTLAYAFKPWKGPEAIGEGASILRYIRDTAREFGIEDKIRFHRRVTSASWSSDEAQWTVQVERGDGGTSEVLTCGFLFVNTGYYRYDAGYAPVFPGRERFTGRIVHPQEWPADLDYAGRRVVVIGSGATAVTLVPALAREAGHVTMVQRSPSYIASLPAQDPLGDAFRRRLPPRYADFLIRWRNVFVAWLIFQLSRHAPKMMRGWLRRGVEGQLPTGYDVDAHFNPEYEPWDQRLCLAPGGDIFEAISAGRASVVTGRIASLTSTGLLLESGEEVGADVIVTATGLNLLMLGGMTIEVDGHPVDPPETVAYKSLMLGGVPNLAFTFGYTNASWTLKSDLAAHYVCRLLNYMDEHDFSSSMPKAPEPWLPTAPYLDLTSGYVRRNASLFPRQGATTPWKVRHNYLLDLLTFKYGPLDDEMEFSGGAVKRDSTPRPLRRTA